MKNWIYVSWEIIKKNLPIILVSSLLTHPLFILISLFTVLGIHNYLVYSIYKKAKEYYSTGNEEFYITFDIKTFFLEGIKILFVRFITLLPIGVSWLVLDIIFGILLHAVFTDPLIILVANILYSLIVDLSFAWIFCSIYYFSFIGFAIYGFDISKVFIFSYQTFIRNILTSLVMFLLFLIVYIVFLLPGIIVSCFTLSLLLMLLFYVIDIIVVCYLSSLGNRLVLDSGGDSK